MFAYCVLVTVTEKMFQEMFLPSFASRRCKDNKTLDPVEPERGGSGFHKLNIFVVYGNCILIRAHCIA